jgi:histidine triad (HIT) family protein
MIAVSYNPANVFAKILRGELPSVAVYDDAATFAFMDIMPAVEGHTLVIPKEPAETIFDLSQDGLAATILATQKVARAVRIGLGCPGVMIAQLNGTAAGQSVPHVHFHILPRTGGVDMALHGRAMVDTAELEIRAALHSLD